MVYLLIFAFFLAKEFGNRLSETKNEEALKKKQRKNEKTKGEIFKKVKSLIMIEEIINEDIQKNSKKC